MWSRVYYWSISTNKPLHTYIRRNNNCTVDLTLDHNYPSGWVLFGPWKGLRRGEVNTTSWDEGGALNACVFPFFGPFDCIISSSRAHVDVTCSSRCVVWPCLWIIIIGLERQTRIILPSLSVVRSGGYRRNTKKVCLSFHRKLLSTGGSG